MTPVTALRSPVSADSETPSRVPTLRPVPAPEIASDGDLKICVVCRRPFKAKRPTAKSCSGKCRVTLSRTRRVEDVVRRLRGAELALAQANDALATLRELVEQGGSRVAP